MRAGAVLLVLTLLAAAAAAQTPSATLTGVVVDATGGVLPSAKVQLSQGGRVVQLVTTDAKGAFAVTAAPGQYNLLVMLDGFRPQATVVEVSSARTTRAVKITLPLAAVRQDVMVTGAAADVALTAASNADAVALTQETLALVPIFDDDAVRTLSRFLDVGSIGGGGATILVNGMEVNGLNVGTAAIEQIKINSDPYSALFSRPGRGRIDIVTKPGSQAYHGDFNAIFRDASLNAKNAFAVAKPPEQRRIADGFLGGPVASGERTSFMLSVKDDTEAREAVVFALQPQGTVRENVSQPFRHLLASVGITHQASRSTIAIRPSYEEESDEYRGVGGETLGTAGTTYYHREIDLTYNQQTILSPSLVNQFQVLGGHELEPLTSVSPLRGMVVSGAFTGGGAQVDVRRTEAHVQLSENLALTSGAHFLQVGFQVPDWSQRGFTDQSDFGGTYYFSSLATYAAGQPYAFTQQTGDGRLNWLEKVLGFYANDDWRLGSRASISLGLRYDWSNYFHDHDNVAPRMSFAFKPGGSDSTVFRGGTGIFYDKVGPFPIIDVLEFRPGGLQRIVLTNPSYPNPFATGAASSVPPSTAQFTPGMKVPWTVQYSGGVEHQLTKSTTLSLMYYGSNGRLLRSRDINAPASPLYAVRPNQTLGVVRQIDASARQRSDSLQATLRGRTSKWFNGQVQYSLSRTMNNSGGLDWYPSNDWNAAAEWARADFDRRQRLLLLAGMAPGRQTNVGVGLTVQSGQPYSETAGSDLFNNGRSNARPPGMPRNSLEGGAFAELDLRLSRDFRVGGGSGPTLTMGIDAFNVLNAINYVTYVGTVTSPLFMQPVSARAARQLQLSARVKF